MGYLESDTIDWQAVRDIDAWLDRDAAREYKDQPLAQDWARVAKISEELGEAITELILSTGQNPRKGKDPTARGRLLNELADVVMTGLFALQHFTKDTQSTRDILREKLAAIDARVPR